LAFGEDASLKWRKKRECGRETDRSYARHGAQTFDDLAMVIPTPVFVVTIRRHVVLNRDQLLMLETKIHRLRFRKTADEQPRAREGNNRKSDLKEHEKIPQLEAAGKTARADPFFQIRSEIGAGCADSGRNTK